MLLLHIKKKRESHVILNWPVWRRRWRGKKQNKDDDFHCLV